MGLKSELRPGPYITLHFFFFRYPWLDLFVCSGLLSCLKKSLFQFNFKFRTDGFTLSSSSLYYDFLGESENPTCPAPEAGTVVTVAKQLSLIHLSKADYSKKPGLVFTCKFSLALMLFLDSNDFLLARLLHWSNLCNLFLMVDTCTLTPVTCRSCDQTVHHTIRSRAEFAKVMDNLSVI